ncbi:hypothetical protein CONLIGDRAFT_586585 [Coniochaeta ligniaria NRRL 30616]|uniref:NAF domain-containing protein n=1 Tax=Coniochaeta ligniaria NRRL 30616 TaxID=1408157 RepID=A0A1J7I5E8_9PEZI|nr:hypothetical protein CONLIGDRAFT_586585 [Coniochaeta ligniaria NRRL 30616]
MEIQEKAESDVLKHRKRVLTPARKEQNRIAQRLYRQRQKTRRQCQQPVSLTRTLDLRPKPMPGQGQQNAHQLEGDTIPKEGARGEAIDLHQQGRSRCSADVVPSCFQPSNGALQDIPCLAVDPNPLDPEVSSPCRPLELAKGLTSTSGTDNQKAPEATSLSWPENTFDVYVLSNNQPRGQDMPQYATDNTTFNLTGIEVGEDPWAPDLSLYLGTSVGSSISCSTLSSTSSFVPGPGQVPFGSYNGTAETYDISLPFSQRSPAGSSRLNTLSDHAISSPLPDPWLNNIQFAKTTIFNAFLTIALSLGFNLSDLFGASCLGGATQSPFYRPTTPQDDPQALLAAARRPCVPSNLQPTLQQILIPHHPFLDLIPFPALRSRAITLAAAMPHAFSMTELKKDVYVHGALVCWVGGRGIGSGQPWDTRSWEAAPWFLRKWMLLLDGVDGEMWKSSTWWQEARREQVKQSSVF